MSTDIGIIGPPQSGKTTVFNALTKGKASTTGHSDGLKPNVGIAKVPDSRLTELAVIFKPKKVTQAEVKYIDVSASIKSLAKDKGIGGELLSQLSNSDTLINVVRAFSNESIPHPEGSVDVERDIANMNMEIIFSDLAIIERRLDRIQASLRGAKPAEKLAFTHEQKMLGSFQEQLEKDIPLRELEFTVDEAKFIANYQFLSAKPLLTIVNIDENQLAEATAMKESLNKQFGGIRNQLLTLCGELEMEIGQLDAEEAVEFMADYGITQSGLDRVLQASYGLLGLISFLTVGPDECRAWPITAGMSAQKSAGKIHSDIERGFIRAEVISYEDLMRLGSLAEGKKQGVLRLEGKEYTVKDGDVINFLFNV